MIKNLQVSDLVEFFQDIPIYVGIPPLGYLQFQKMERAKTLLRGGMSVRQTGVEIGMPDPYHFSKQFKHIVGMSPTAYLKHVGPMEPDGRA